MQNDGFGALYNRRPLDVVLQPVRGGKPYKFRAVDDIRLLFPAPGERKSISLTIPVSSRLPAGNYDILLHLPDVAPNLADRPSYSIRLANTNLWEPATGMNALGIRVRIVRAR